MHRSTRRHCYLVICPIGGASQRLRPVDSPSPRSLYNVRNRDQLLRHSKAPLPPLHRHHRTPLSVEVSTTLLSGGRLYRLPIHSAVRGPQSTASQGSLSGPWLAPHLQARKPVSESNLLRDHKRRILPWPSSRVLIASRWSRPASFRSIPLLDQTALTRLSVSRVSHLTSQ